MRNNIKKIGGKTQKNIICPKLRNDAIQMFELSKKNNLQCNLEDLETTLFKNKKNENCKEENSSMFLSVENPTTESNNSRRTSKKYSNDKCIIYRNVNGDISGDSCEGDYKCVKENTKSVYGKCQQISKTGGKRTSKNKKGGNTSLKLNLPQGPNMDCGSPFHPRWSSVNSMSKLNSLPNMNGYIFHQEGNLGFIKGGNKKRTYKNKKGGLFGFFEKNKPNKQIKEALDKIPLHTTPTYANKELDKDLKEFKIVDLKNELKYYEENGNWYKLLLQYIEYRIINLQKKAVSNVKYKKMNTIQKKAYDLRKKVLKKGEKCSPLEGLDKCDNKAKLICHPKRKICVNKDTINRSNNRNINSSS